MSRSRIGNRVDELPLECDAYDRSTRCGVTRPLRMRKLTVEPGGILGLHTHKDRPAVNYFLQGAITYHQDGKPDVTLSAGDGIAEGKDTTHWGENRGSVAAVFLAIDIPK